MNSSQKNYEVKFIREEGKNPLTGIELPYGEQIVTINAPNVNVAVSLAKMSRTINFNGQRRSIYVNNHQYHDPSFENQIEVPYTYWDVISGGAPGLVAGGDTQIESIKELLKELLKNGYKLIREEDRVQIGYDDTNNMFVII